LDNHDVQGGTSKAPKDADFDLKLKIDMSAESF
jgi:hypothetical protein